MPDSAIVVPVRTGGRCVMVACDVVEFDAVWGSGVVESCCSMCADIARDNPDVVEFRAVESAPGICAWCEAEAEAEAGGGE
jgi:hypothetical protein